MMIIMDSFLCKIYHYFVIQNMNSHECTDDHDHFFVITLILVSIPVQSLSALMAYHLTCQHVKFSSSFSFFLPYFVQSIFLCYHNSINMKISMIIYHVKKLFCIPLFLKSLMHDVM